MHVSVAVRLLRKLGYGRTPVQTVQPQVHDQPQGRPRPAVDHVILIDGTLGTLHPDSETHIGCIYRLLRAAPPPARTSLYYDKGDQWCGWLDTASVAMGRGINDQIRRAYGWLASRYRPGDRIFLFGYSRGAFAARSLAGVIDRVGLLRPDSATERNVTLAWRYYRRDAPTAIERTFTSRHCHARAEVEMIGAFDTVKALGIRLPLLWRWSEPRHEFHSHRLSPIVRHGFHALALDETRVAFAPVLWETGSGDWQGRVDQVWFRGAHGDVGGQLSGKVAARGLSNIPLVWMLERAERFGLRLPPDWRHGLPTDPGAPSVGTWRGWGKVFLIRGRRTVGRDPSERLHPTAAAHHLTRPTEAPAVQPAPRV
jgi:uncharacterized protein (DUF2235 family)